MRATDLDQRATPPCLARISLDGVPAPERAALLSDELAQRLTAGRARTHGASLPRLEWLNADLGDGLVVAEVDLGGLDVRRTAAMAAAGDDDCTLFLARSDGVRFEQAGHQQALGRGDGVFVAHSRAVRSWYDDERLVLVRLPRAALAPYVAPEAAAGLRLAADAEPVVLLQCYLDALLRRATAGQEPSALARRHVVELARAAVVGALGHEEGGDPAARNAARLERMLACIAARSAEPGLGMAEVAGAVGLSARSGYLVFAAAGLDFSAHLTAVRLDRAYEWLERAGPTGARVLDVALGVGFCDLSHFNRRFRERFGCTPREVRAGAG